MSDTIIASEYFTQSEIDHILTVKGQIKNFIEDMTWADWYKTCVQDINAIIYLTGGAIASLLQGEEPKDWDFYFTFKSDMEFFETYIKNFESEIKEFDGKYKELGFNGRMVTANATTMSNGASFITMMYGKPDEVRSTFDYVHCLPYYDLFTDKLHISSLQYDCCVHKSLIVNNKEAYKEYRNIKFRDRGYTVYA
jgi:hypothetical protein